MGWRASRSIYPRLFLLQEVNGLLAVLKCFSSVMISGFGLLERILHRF